jgi:Fe2+ or Zn2+ uptake regulation protein
MASKVATRETLQRRVVFETIKGTRSHPTADWIFERARAKMPKISLGTVYRNLSILKREGLIKELHAADRRARYEELQEPHTHFICVSCNEIRDVEEQPEMIWQTCKELVGCEVVEQRMELYGYCAACQHHKKQSG